MTETTKRILPLPREFTEKAKEFFGGRLYPAAIAAAVLIGHVTALEFYIAIPILLVSAFAFLVCDSVKHFIPTLLTFLFLVNLKHTPGSMDGGINPGSDYYSQPYVFITMAVMFAILLTAAILYTLTTLVPRIKEGGKAPLLLPLSLLSAAFLLGGAFSSGWQIASLVFGFAEAAVYFLLFYLFYYGLKRENINGLISYVCYIALLSAFVIITELVFVYATRADAIFADGVLHKEAIALGWGISNPIGNALVMLVPLLMLGAIRCKAYPVYLVATLLTCVGVFFTFSRNGIVVCLLVLTASVVVAYFTSTLKKTLGISLCCGMGAVTVGALIFSDKLAEIVTHFSRIGSADNGRFKLWKQSLDNFLDSPIFGKGFFDWGEMDVYEIAGFVPTMSHNTVLQLMSSMGIVGLGTYVFYRAMTLIPFFKNISREKIFIFLSVAALLLGGMLDNFMFYFQGVFLYVILLALVFLMRDYEQEFSYGHEFDEDDEEDDEEGYTYYD